MSRAPDLPPIDAAGVLLAEVRIVDLRLRRPHRSAHDEVATRPSVIVRVVLDDGTSGWGECPALPVAGYSDERAAGAFALFRDVLLPSLLRGVLPAAGRPPMASGAVRDALLDAVLRREHRSLVDVLGGQRREVPARSIVSAATVDDLMDVVDERVTEGYRHIGLKVGPTWLDEPIGAVRAAWPDLGLSVDANGSLGALDAAGWKRLDAFGLDSIEQPCPDLAGCARVAAIVDCAVALDEPIVTLDDLEAAVAAAAGGMVNVKPARMGGTAAAAALASAAVDRGMVVFVGGMLESGVGRAAALAVAAMDLCTEPTHLGPSVHYWQTDLTEPIVTGAAGHVVVPVGEGIGVAPDPRRLDDATVEIASVEG